MPSKNNNVKYFIMCHKCFIHHSALTQKIETNPNALKFKVNDRVRIPNYKNAVSEVCTKNWSRELFFIDSLLKTNSWTYKIKDLNEEVVIGSFYEK